MKAVVQKKMSREISPEPSDGKMSYEKFLAWCNEDTWAEWVDGEVKICSPASYRHQNIRGFLESVLSIYIEEHKLGQVLGAPFQMLLSSVSRGREPDLLFVSQKRLILLKETYLDGPADLVIEIVSPESVGRDRGEKFVEYEAAGVNEYWLIDPQRQQVEFYRLGDDGLYQLVPVGSEGVYRSEALPGFWLRVGWLWQKPLPPVLEVLREIGVI